jgi:hypothetical protein
MKTIKRKAKRIADRPIKKKVLNRNIYAGSEEAMLNKVVEIIVKIIKKRLVYNELGCSMAQYYNSMGLVKSFMM